MTRSPTQSFLSVHHVGIVADDLDRAVSFYETLLGAAREDRIGHTLVSAGDVRIAIVARGPEDPKTWARGAHLCLCAPVERRNVLIERIRELAAPHEETRGRLYVRDPEGYTLEFLFSAS